MADSKLSSLALLLTKRLCTLTLDYNHVVKRMRAARSTSGCSDDITNVVLYFDYDTAFA